MAVTSFDSGTKASTIGTLHTIGAVNAAGVYVLLVDTVNMAAGDTLELRASKIVLTSGTKRGEFVSVFYGAQPTDDLIKQSIPIPNDLTDSSSVEFTLKQTFGTSRNYPWKVLKIV